MKRTLTCLIALSLWLAPLGAPEVARAATPVAVEYRPAAQTLVVQVPDGIVPGIQELSNPPRFVVDLPGAPPAKPVDLAYAQGLVQRFVAARRGDGTRIVLHLRAPVRDAWAVRMEGSRLLFVFSPRAPLPQRPAPVSAGKTPPPVPSPRPRATVRPTPRPTAKPTPRVTAPPATPSPVPQLTPIEMPPEVEATGAMVPSPTPVPVAATPQPTPVPTPRPTATPAPAQKTPPPRPMPTPKPKASATPAPRPGVRAVRPAAGNYVRVGKLAYDEATRFFTVPVSRRVAPTFSMEAMPPQLVMDLPGSVVGPTQTRKFAGGLVTEATAYQHTPTSTRVILTLARPIGTKWSIKQTGGKLILIFDRRPVALPQAPRPTAKPAAPKPTSPRPATARPAAPKPTPKPKGNKTYSFTGSVFSINSGVPIAGATINIGGRVAKSNRDGQFSFPALPAGLHPVTVTASGFATQKFNIVVPEDRTLSLNLVPALQ